MTVIIDRPRLASSLIDCAREENVVGQVQVIC